MKPPLITPFRLAFASALTVAFALAACETTKGRTFVHSAGALLQLSSGKHIRIGVSMKRFAQALKNHAVEYETEYCAKTEKGIVCEQINPGTISEVLGTVKTTNVTKAARAETGAGDEIKPDAIHVAQRAKFLNAAELEAFLEAIDKN